MLTLALDTTTRAGSVAVVRDDLVLATVSGDATRTHGERLPAEIEQALQQAGVLPRELQLLTVASGPGAFTGLRIGLAAMQGLAMVLDRPVIGVSALDALALAARAAGGASRAVAAWMDAQRGEVFAAHYAAAGQGDMPTPLAAPIVATPTAALASLPPATPIVFIGDGAVRYDALIRGRDHAILAAVAPPLAPWLATIGIARARRGEAGPPHALQPLYVRRPDAELERLRRETR